MEETEFIWMNGEYVKWEDAKVHILTHSLHYGTGVFEGIRCYKTDKGVGIFRLRDHVKRLINSTKLVGMNFTYKEDDIVETIKELVRKNKIESGYIRPIVYYGYGKMGLGSKGAKLDFGIACWPWGAYLGEEGFNNGIKVKMSNHTRPSNTTIPSEVKTTGEYMASMLAEEDAVRDGYTEALLKDHKGFIAEGPGENFFVVKDGILKTPNKGSILPGITRDSIMKLAESVGIKIEEIDMTEEDVYSADEAFFCGTAAEVTPISQISEQKIGLGNVGELTKKLQQMYMDLVHGKNEQLKEWVELV